MTEKCHGCVYYFKGIDNPAEGCVRNLDPETCKDGFTEKWYSGNDDGFRDSIEEQYLTLDEWKEFLETKDKLRLAVLREMLKDVRKDEQDVLPSEKGTSPSI